MSNLEYKLKSLNTKILTVEYKDVTRLITMQTGEYKKLKTGEYKKLNP